MAAKVRVLFVCTENSARSQMAEALMRHFYGKAFEVFSAGTAPTEIDPKALQALAELKLDASGLKPNAVTDFADIPFDYVITLCDKARQECPAIAASREHAHWDFPDPKNLGVDGFKKIAQQIAERIKLFALVKLKKG